MSGDVRKITSLKFGSNLPYEIGLGTTEREELDSAFSDINDNFDILNDTIEDNEEIVSNALNDLEERKANKTDVPTIPTNVSTFTNDAGYATQTWVGQQGYLTQHQDISAYFNGVEYDSNSKRINFKNGNTIKTYIDATAFIKDGMIDTVTISNGNLVLTFNTDAGKQPISIALSDIFDSDEYYTKDEIDATERVIALALTDLDDRKVDSSDLSSVATSGSYNDLSNKPVIPDVSDIRSTLYGDSQSSEIDLTQYTVQNAYPYQGNWLINAYYKSKFIPCIAGDKYIFSNVGGSHNAAFAFLKNNTVVSGQPVEYAGGGTTVTSVLVGEKSGEVTAPQDATYIWMATQNGANTPNEMTSITHIESVAGLTEKVDGLSDKVEKLDTNIISPIKTFSRNNLPVVSFIFDDIHDNDEQIVDLFDSYGLTGGFAFVATDAKIAVYKNKYIAWQKRGYSILNHSIDGNPINTTTCPTIADAYSVVATAKSKLEKAGFVVNGWVSPDSTFPDAYLDVLNNLHSYAYIGSSSNTRYTHPCMLSRLSLQTTLLSDILDTNSNNQSSIAFYVAVNRQLTFYGHAAELGNTPTGGEEFSIAKIRSVIEKCIELRDEGKLLILSPDDMYRYFFGSLPASTIWTGTQAAYDNLSSDLKSRIIAFITE